MEKIYTFYIDSWSSAFIEQFINNVKDSLNLSYNIFDVAEKINTIGVYNSMPIVNGYKLNFDIVTKYDMSIYNNEGLNILETLYSDQLRTLRHVDVQDRITYYLNELSIALEKHIKKYNTAALIIYSPINATRIMASFVARANNIPVVVITDSPFKNYYMLDRNYAYQVGILSSVGFYNSIKSIEFTELENEQYKNWVDDFKNNKQTRGCNKQFAFNNLKQELPDKNYILVVGQSPTDANQIIHQRDIPYDPVKLITKLLTWCDKPIYFKPHPDDLGNVHKELRSNHTAMLQNMGIKIIDHAINVHDAIKNAETIITWNSNIGIEALVYHKNVVTLGESFIRNKNLTFDLEGYGDIQYLESKINTPINDINHFLKFLICRFLIRDNNITGIVNRVNDLAFGEPNYGV